MSEEDAEKERLSALESEMAGFSHELKGTIALAMTGRIKAR